MWLVCRLSLSSCLIVNVDISSRQKKKFHITSYDYFQSYSRFGKADWTAWIPLGFVERFGRIAAFALRSVTIGLSFSYDNLSLVSQARVCLLFISLSLSEGYGRIHNTCGNVASLTIPYKPMASPSTFTKHRLSAEDCPAVSP